jgi:hypothetical protein
LPRFAAFLPHKCLRNQETAKERRFGALTGCSGMTRSISALNGFGSDSPAVASPCLHRAVAVSLAFAALSLCLSVALTIAAIGASYASPLLN